MNREQIKEKMVSAMDLPKDVIQNASVITILGRNELCIENYRGIIEYTDTLIRVQTRAGQIHCLIRYLSGYVKIQIKGYSPERFLNLCCYHRIRFWGLTRIGTNYELYLSLSDFRKIRPYVRKTHTKVILKKRYGFPFFLYRYRKRKLFFISIFLCIFLINCYSQFLWDIRLGICFS